MANFNNSKWMLVNVEEDGGDERLGLYVDGRLIGIGRPAVRAVMESSLEQGWDGHYEQLHITEAEATYHCDMYQHFPRLLSAITMGTGAEGEVCKFPWEVD